MTPTSESAAVTEHGAYEARGGRRQVMIVQYGENDFAVLDLHAGTQQADLDERVVESELAAFEEAEAIARDYLANARRRSEPLVRAT